MKRTIDIENRSIILKLALVIMNRLRFVKRKTCCCYQKKDKLFRLAYQKYIKQLDIVNILKNQIAFKGMMKVILKKPQTKLLKYLSSRVIITD